MDELPVFSRYEIQARRQRREIGRATKDETDLDVAPDLATALGVARSYTDQGFTSWIFQVEQGMGTAPTYRMVTKLRPRSGSTNRAETDRQPHPGGHP